VSGELAREQNGHLVFGDVVARVAETLSPLGAAARVAAEICATRVEMRRLSLEGNKIEAAKMEAVLRLEHRDVAVGKSIHEMRRTVTATEVNAKQIRAGIAAAQRAIFQRNISLREKEVYKEFCDMQMKGLIENHVGGGNMLTDQIDKVLNGDGALGPNQPRRNSSGEQRHGGARNRDRCPR
jgi:hypothetical protein